MVQELDFQYLKSLGDLPIRILYLALILLCGFLFSYIIKKIEKRISSKEITSDAIKQKITLNVFFIGILKYAVYIVLSMLVLGVLLKSSANSFFLTVAGAVSVALGIGSQTIVKDVLSGIFILFEKQYSVGDRVTINDTDGVVEEVGIRTTKLRSKEGNLIIIPNSEIRIVSNKTDAFVQSLTEIDLASRNDDGFVISILKDEMDKIYTKLYDELSQCPEVVGVTSFSESGFTIKICAHFKFEDCQKNEAYLRRAVKKRLYSENIYLAKED